MKHRQRLAAVIGACIIIITAGCAAPVIQPLAQAPAAQAPAAQPTIVQAQAEKTASARPSRGTFSTTAGSVSDDEMNTLLAGHNQSAHSVWLAPGRVGCQCSRCRAGLGRPDGCQWRLCPWSEQQVWPISGLAHLDFSPSPRWIELGQ